MRYAEIQDRAVPVFERDRKSTRSGAASFTAGRQVDDFVHTPRQAARHRELTTLNIVLLLAISAIVVTAYIANTVMVDNLMRSITTADREMGLLLQQRESLRAEINYLSSSTRVQKIAVNELQLVHSQQQPYSLIVFGLPKVEEEK